MIAAVRRPAAADASSPVTPRLGARAAATHPVGDGPLHRAVEAEQQLGPRQVGDHQRPGDDLHLRQAGRRRAAAAATARPRGSGRAPSRPRRAPPRSPGRRRRSTSVPQSGSAASTMPPGAHDAGHLPHHRRRVLHVLEHALAAAPVGGAVVQREAWRVGDVELAARAAPPAERRRASRSSTRSRSTPIARPPGAVRSASARTSSPRPQPTSTTHRARARLEQVERQRLPAGDRVLAAHRVEVAAERGGIRVVNVGERAEVRRALQGGNTTGAAPPPSGVGRPAGGAPAGRPARYMAAPCAGAASVRSCRRSTVSVRMIETTANAAATQKEAEKPFDERLRLRDAVLDAALRGGRGDGGQDRDAEGAADLLTGVDEAGGQAGVLCLTPASAAIDTGTNENPSPTPISMKPGNRSAE